jgi:hypothetical protein
MAFVKHILGKRQSQNSYHPTRLLDVRHGPSKKVRLRTHTLHFEKDVRYAALSHCWGDPSKILQLKSSTLEHFIRGINIADLPQTFQEAIKVALSLDIHYIWIDSLCIIQDSKDDWDTEAQQMARIYQNAFCTIAASAAWDGSEGLFRPQDPYPSSPCLVGVERDEYPLYAVYRPQSDERTLQTDLTMSKWNSRGWVLQERQSLLCAR